MEKNRANSTQKTVILNEGVNKGNIKPQTNTSNISVAPPPPPKPKAANS
jgi:hypothetical protein